MSDIQPNQYFVANNGTIIKNLPDLITALKSMDDSCFSHHVNENKNDFSEWIKHVLHDEKLAEKVRNTSSSKEMAQKLTRSTNKTVKKIEKEEKASDIDKIVEISNEKIDEILRREREIELKEEKIQEIEDKIEKQLGDMKKPPKKGFFTKEFIQGMIVGFLICVFLVLIYFKFFS